MFAHAQRVLSLFFVGGRDTIAKREIKYANGEDHPAEKKTQTHYTYTYGRDREKRARAITMMRPFRKTASSLRFCVVGRLEEDLGKKDILVLLV